MSKEDTLKHILRVQALIDVMQRALFNASIGHDRSKLLKPEVDAYETVVPKLKELTYGSEEYKKSVRELGPALQHHYATNRHHPEHYDNGVSGMTLVDLVEMLCDWKAATERHDDGCIDRSMEINKDRFKLDDQLQSILQNTVDKYLKD